VIVFSFSSDFWFDLFFPCLCMTQASLKFLLASAQQAMSSRKVFLNQPIFLVLERRALQKLNDLETYCYARTRRKRFPHLCACLLFLVVSACAACTGLFLAQTMTLGEADEVCRHRFAVAMSKLSQFREDFWEHSKSSLLLPGLGA
jgi:hypothetical protein